MTTPTHIVPLGLLLLLSAALPAARGVSRAGTDQASELVFQSLSAESFDPSTLRTSLEQLGGDALPELFGILAYGEVILGDAATPLDYGHELALSATLCRDGAALRSFLTTLFDSDADERLRITGMRLLGRCGTDRDTNFLLRLAPRSKQRSIVEPRVRAALIAALTAIERRHPSTLDHLVRLYTGIPRGALPSVIGYLATHRRGGAERLAGLLGAVPDADELVLLELGRLVRDGSVELNEQGLEKVRLFLSRGDSSEISLASCVLGHVRDRASVPALIKLLEDPRELDEGALGQLQEALEGIAGGQVATDHSTWKRWLEQEQEWLTQKAPALGLALRSGDAAQAVLAIREFASHRFHSDAVSAFLAEGLRRKELDVVRLTCAALEQLESESGVHGLLECLRHPEPAARGFAHQSLMRLTGSNLPLDHKTWATFLSRRTAGTLLQKAHADPRIR